MELTDPPDLLITAKDLAEIKSLAIKEYRNLPMTVIISNKVMEQKDLSHISLANALILWLSSKGALSRLAKFDYTDRSFDYEGIEE